MPLRFCHAGDFHLDEDRYFADTARCVEWFVADAIRASVDLFVINGDLTTYKASSGCCQWQGVRAHAAPGDGSWRNASSRIHLSHAARVGAGKSSSLCLWWQRVYY